MVKKDTTFMIIMACSFIGLFMICMIFSCGMTGAEDDINAAPTEDTTSSTTLTTETTTETETTKTTAGTYYVIKMKNDAINIRSGPGLDFGKVGTAFAGDRYLYMGEEKASDGKLWYHVQTSYITGWIGSQFCDKSEIEPSELEDLLNPRTTKTTTSTSTSTTTTTTTTTETPTETTESAAPTTESSVPETPSEPAPQETPPEETGE